jgi:primosomal protein N' (replication factor Y)
VILGSATPSLESFQRTKEGTCRLLELPRRILDRPLPDVGVIDLRCESRSRYTRGAISRPLHQAMQQAVEEGGQIILLLNRRGFSTSRARPPQGKPQPGFWVRPPLRSRNSAANSASTSS